MQAQRARRALRRVLRAVQRLAQMLRRRLEVLPATPLRLAERAQHARQRVRRGWLAQRAASGTRTRSRARPGAARARPRRATAAPPRGRRPARWPAGAGERFRRAGPHRAAARRRGRAGATARPRSAARARQVRTIVCANVSGRPGLRNPASTSASTAGSASVDAGERRDVPQLGVAVEDRGRVRDGHRRRGQPAGAARARRRSACASRAAPRRRGTRGRRGRAPRAGTGRRRWRARRPRRALARAARPSASARNAATPARLSGPSRTTSDAATASSSSSGVVSPERTVTTIAIACPSSRAARYSNARRLGPVGPVRVVDGQQDRLEARGEPVQAVQDRERGVDRGGRPAVEP